MPSATRPVHHLSRIIFHVSRFPVFWYFVIFVYTLLTEVAYSQDIRISAELNSFMDAFSGGIHKVEASVDNSHPYVNGQITYTFRYLYTERIASLDAPKYTFPSWTGFWERKLDQKPSRVEAIDETPYWMVEIQVVLFPMTAGKMTIEPARLSLPISSYAGRVDSPKVLTTDPIEINVHPLPQAGRPANFTGVVGQYHIHAHADRGSVKVGDGFTLRLRIAGTGNIETSTAPFIPAIPNMTVYDPKITDVIAEADSKIQWNHTYEYVVIPLKEGNWTIPAIEYPYFDSVKESYQIAHTVPITIDVLPNANGATDTTTMRPKQAGMRFLKQDIQYAKLSPLKLTDQPVYPYKRASFWGLQIVPIIVVLFAQLCRQRRAKHNLSHIRQQNAAKKAFRAIADAEQYIVHGPTTFFAALATGLYQYIGDVFDMSPTGLNPELVHRRCKEAGFPESATTQFVKVLAWCDYVRFAPVSANSTDIKNALNDAKAAIHQIEKA